MELVVLSDHPSAIDQVAAWYFKHWGHAHPDTNLSRVKETLIQFIQNSAPPILVLARDKHDFIGSAQLKIRKLALFPDYKFWLSDIYVDPAYRQSQVMALLINKVIEKAHELEIRRLYLQTVKLDGGRYKAFGFNALKIQEQQGRKFLLMEVIVN